MQIRTWTFLALLLASLIAGCKSKPVDMGPAYDKPLPPGQLALRRITDPGDLPNFQPACYDLADVSEALENSLSYLGKPSSETFYPYGEITHEHVVASLEAFRDLLEARLPAEQMDQAIRDQFDVYVSVGCDDRGTVLYTGYYTPIFNGSLTETPQYRYPLYTAPSDLVKGPQGEILGRRLDDDRVVPYPSRAQIESSPTPLSEALVWLSDPFEVYIAHVQGSAKIRTPDDTLITVGYAASNGHEYHSISQMLVDDGKIDASEISLARMIKYFKNHPDQVNHYTRQNPRFVFFRRDDGPPHGSLNEPVIAWRSIATDKAIYPRAALALLVTNLPQISGARIKTGPYSGFALDQDTGGAIRAPGRCDVYMGQGRLAGMLAGQTYQEGKLYYLFLKKPAQLPADTLAEQP